MTALDDVRRQDKLCLKLLGCAVKLFCRDAPPEDVANHIGSFISQKEAVEIIGLIKATRNVVTEQIEWTQHHDEIQIAIDLLRAVLDVTATDPRDWAGKRTQPLPAVSAFLAAKGE